MQYISTEVGIACFVKMWYYTGIFDKFSTVSSPAIPNDTHKLFGTFHKANCAVRVQILRSVVFFYHSKSKEESLCQS